MRVPGGAPTLPSVELLILRHGKALGVGEHGISRDEHRELSPAGRSDISEVGQSLARWGALPERAFSSPLTRALQTAQLALESAGSDVGAESETVLEPGADPGAIMQMIVARARNAARVLVVGHAPDVGNLVEALVAPQGLEIRMSPGTLARVDISRPGTALSGHLVLLRPPAS